FGLLKRAYIEARYSRSYRVTSEELGVMRSMVADLGERVRHACADKLRELSPNGEVPTLVGVPAITDIVELPDLPDLSDPNSVEAWREAVTRLSYARGRNEGEQHGLEKGLARGRDEGRQEERARAVVEVLRRRGVALTEEQARRVLACRDEATLTRWWEQAWTVSSADELR
ncbi:MAG TPA: hypothetical protein VIV60_37460, partial [Polyangiaceae bacterium]